MNRPSHWRLCPSLRRFIAHTTAFVVLGLMLSAQPHAQQMSLQEYGQPDGLQNLAVTSLAQDGARFIWAGTQNGLYRFDGNRFERVGVAEKLSSVTSLLADGPRLWIAADDGLWLWLGGRLQRVVAEGTPAEVSHLPQAVAADGGGGAWVIGEQHLWHLTPAPGGWHREDVLAAQGVDEPLRAAAVTSVFSVPGGDLWFGCGRRLCRRHAGAFDAWGEESGVDADRWHWLMRAHDGSLWVRGVAHVLQLKPGATRFSDRTYPGDAVDPKGKYTLVEDAQHRIIGAARGALMRWNGQSWHRFGTDAGLPAGGRLPAMLSDSEGGLWIGMLGAGVLRWRGYGQWENWSVASGLPHTAVWRFARSGPANRQTLYVATGAGVAWLDGDTGRFRPLGDFDNQETQGLATDASGDLWIGTVQGRLDRFASASSPVGTGTTLSVPGAKAIQDIFVQRSGDVWVTTNAGLHRRAAGDALDLPLPVVSTGSEDDGMFEDGCEDKLGAMWFAGRFGLARYNGERWDHPFGSRVSRSVLACLHDGSLVTSSGSDGLHLVNTTSPSASDRDITPAELSGRNILALHEDSRGWLWVNTDAGVAVWNRVHWRLLDQLRGLVWNDTSGNALFEDLDGSMWIGTSRGASHILEPSRLFEPVTGLVSIRWVKRGVKSLPPTQKIELPWSTDSLEIGLALPIFRDREALQMQYRLRGLDDRWIPLEHPEVGLTGLPPGRYRFEARAIDRELGVPSPPTGMELYIEPPWWRSWLTAAAAVVATLSFAYALYSWRIRVIRQRSRQLQQLVSERTRELEASREELRELATKDSLTGVWNRRALMEILDREASRCVRDRVPMTVAFADIDHFKRVNDTHGHAAGDEVLRAFAKRLMDNLRPYDSIGRYGGEEFVLVMPGLDITRPEHRARVVAVHESIASAPMSTGTITCSFGVVVADGAGALDVAALIDRADQALYRAKLAGRDRIEWVGLA